jgi:hypothetical protein
MKDFAENEDLEFSNQLNTFASVLPTYSSTLGITPAEETEAQKDADFFAYVMNRQFDVQAFAEELTGYKNLARYGRGTEILPALPTPPTFPAPAPSVVAARIEERFRKKAAKIKASPNYTDSIGQALRIVKPETPFVPADGKPKFKIIIDAGRPVIKWTKGQYQGVDIYADYGDGQGFRKAERDLSSPFVDRHNLPAAGQSAVWKYKLIYVFKDEQVGQWSDEASVTVIGTT